MVEPKKEPEHPPQAPNAADEDTFLFMGTRISLGSQAAKRPPGLDAPKSQEAAAETTESSHTPASPQPTEEAATSSKSTFDFAPLAKSLKPGSSSRIFLAGAGLLLVAAAVVFVWHRFGSIEARILAAANRGHLAQPRGSSAYDLYQRLKADGLSPVAKNRLRLEVLPKLSVEGEALLKKLYDGSDLVESEQDLLVRIYEWAADLDAQDGSLAARRAYAAGYRSVFRKADKEALAAFREAFQSDSQWALPFRDLAKLYERAGNHPNAEYFYQQAVQLDPKWTLPDLDLARLYLEQNRLAEAELAYRRAAEADLTLVEPWHLLAQLYERQKRKVDAIAAYERAIQLATEHPSSRVRIDEIRDRLEKIR